MEDNMDKLQKHIKLFTSKSRKKMFAKGYYITSAYAVEVEKKRMYDLLVNELGLM